MAVVNSMQAQLVPFAKAVCRTQVVGSGVLQSGFFFAPRLAVTGVHFKLRDVFHVLLKL